MHSTVPAHLMRLDLIILEVLGKDKNIIKLIILKRKSWQQIVPKYRVVSQKTVTFIGRAFNMKHAGPRLLNQTVVYPKLFSLHVGFLKPSDRDTVQMSSSCFPTWHIAYMNRRSRYYLGTALP